MKLFGYILACKCKVTRWSAELIVTFTNNRNVTVVFRHWGRLEVCCYYLSVCIYFVYFLHCQYCKYHCFFVKSHVVSG